MDWLALAVVVVGTVYFTIHYPGFRRGLLFALLGIVALLVLGGVVGWFHSQQEAQQRQIARALIKPDQIEITDAMLWIGSEMKAVVTNKSPYHLADLALKVTVMDCPANVFDKFDPSPPPGFVLDRPSAEPRSGKEVKCTAVGQYVAKEYGVNIPSGQKRAFRGYVRFDNLPPLKPNEWRWHYSIDEIVAGSE
jgi:hypothetical protein